MSNHRTKPCRLGTVARVALATLTSLLLARTAEPKGIDLESWLDRPGVKLLAVDFYATQCAPCIQAVSRWKELHERHRADGFRLVIVVARDAEGRCANPGWHPDSIVCDDDGRIAEALSAGDQLPAAFLWSWQGGLLVRRGTFDEVEIAVTKWFSKAPRVAVSVTGVDEASGVTREELWRLVEGEIQRTGKLVIIASAEERKRLYRLKAESMKPLYDDRVQPEIGKDLPANSLLEVWLGGEARKLHLRLLSAERGYLVASSVATWSPQGATRAVGDGVASLLSALRSDASKPDTRSRSAGVGQAVVSFSSNPPRATVRANGEVLCPDSADTCAKSLPLGEYVIAMEMVGRRTRTERIEVAGRTAIDWKLEADAVGAEIPPAPATAETIQSAPVPSPVRMNPRSPADGTLDTSPSAVRLRDEAIADLERAASKTAVSDRPDLFVRLSALYWDKARALRARRGPPSAPDAAGVFRRAVAVADRVLREAPESPGNDLALYLVARSSHAIGEIEQVRARYASFVEKHPRSRLLPHVYYGWGEILFDAKEFEAARQAFENAALSGEPEVRAHARYMEAWCNFSLAEYERAIAGVRQVASLGSEARTADLRRAASEHEIYFRSVCELRGACPPRRERR